MKIKKMKITNVKGINSLLWNPEKKIYCLIGENGTSKTSFREALQFALTGEVFSSPFASVGTNDCSVEIELESGTTFVRHFSSNTKSGSSVEINGRRSTAKSLSEALLEETGLSADSLKISTTGDIGSMKPAELSDYLLNYIPESYNADSLLSICSFDAEQEALVRSVLPPMPQKFGVSEIDRVYSVLSEQLKATKRELSNFKSELTGLADYAEIPSVRNVDDIEKDIMQLYETEGKRKVLLSKKVNIQAEKANIKRMEETLSKLPSHRPAPILEKELKKEITKLENEIQTKLQVIKVFETNSAFFENALAVLSTPICPLSEKLKCDLDKTIAKEEIQDCINGNTKAKEIENRSIEKLLKEKNEKEKELENVLRTIEDYKKYLILSNELNEAKKLLSKEDETIEKIDVEAELYRLTEEKKATVNYLRFKELKEKSENAEKRQSVLSHVINAFKPGGLIKSHVVGYYLTVFQDICNKRAKEMGTEMLFEFAYDEGVKISVRPKNDGPYLPVSALSSGEKCIATFILLDMINELNGLGILIIDDLDKLDAQNIKILKKIISKPSIQDSYDHIVLCSVNHPDIVKELKAIM